MSIAVTKHNEQKDGWETRKQRLWILLESRLAVYLRSFAGLREEDREDVLQTALIAFWKEGPQEEVDARPWLYRVLRNAAIDTQRSRHREFRTRLSCGPGAEAPWERIAEPGPGPEEDLLSAEEEAFVREFLLRLSDAEREFSFLAFSEGMTYKHIAEVTGVPLGTVKWRLGVIKKRLAKHYRRRMS